MTLPAFPPHFTFPRLSNGRDDIDFAFEVKRAAMGPHIVKRWAWDEAFQRDLHERRFVEKPFFTISRNGQQLGTVSFQVLSDHVRFGEFYLLPQHHGRGTGSVILAHSLNIADGLNLPVRLEHLHWSPVGSLYRRHGFVEVSRSEIHCFMERPTATLRADEEVALAHPVAH